MQQRACYRLCPPPPGSNTQSRVHLNSQHTWLSQGCCCSKVPHTCNPNRPVHAHEQMPPPPGPHPQTKEPLSSPLPPGPTPTHLVEPGVLLQQLHKVGGLLDLCHTDGQLQAKQASHGSLSGVQERVWGADETHSNSLQGRVCQRTDMPRCIRVCVAAQGQTGGPWHPVLTWGVPPGDAKGSAASSGSRIVWTLHPGCTSHTMHSTHTWSEGWRAQRSVHRHTQGSAAKASRQLQAKQAGHGRLWAHTG
jgi:hypothetical protein